MQSFEAIPILNEALVPPSAPATAVYIPAGTNKTSTFESISKAFTLHAMQQQFSLNININEVWQVYLCLVAIEKHLKHDSCGRTSLKPSLVATGTADRMVGHFQRFVVLHLRRGDTLDLCDNSPENISDFMRCQVDKTKLSSYQAVIFFTNDESGEYIEAVKSRLETFAPWQVIHGDAAVIELLKLRGVMPDGHTDNYLVYEVYKAVAARAKLMLSFGGHEPHQFEKCKRQTSCAERRNSSVSLVLQAHSASAISHT
jgi:hypothetical protein